MKTVNSLSGGKTSSYIAANYPADANVFSLVRTNDKDCLFPDAKLRQVVSDKIGKEFVGTLEMDTIIHTMLDLEQFIGSKIDWVTGKTFDEVLQDKKTLPNVTRRFCTQEMKLVPIKEWWYKNIKEIVEMRIGYRANEQRRAKNMISKTNKEGILVDKFVVGRSKNGNRNKWGELEWQKPTFPLISDSIYRDNIEEYWKGKPVRFAKINNCVGCFHQNKILLRKRFEWHPKKMEWFKSKEGVFHENDIWRNGGDNIRMKDIENWNLQSELSFDDFNECDSGYCGL